MNKTSDASIVKMLEQMQINQKYLSARDIGLSITPIRSLNTIIKNISYLRIEFGDGLILDDKGHNAAESNEYWYLYNLKHVLKNDYCKNISEGNRSKIGYLLRRHHREKDTWKPTIGIPKIVQKWKQYFNEICPNCKDSYHTKHGKCTVCGKER